MAILGGSPLGLIGATSKPIGNISTFNAGRTRNVNVSAYNQSNAGSLFTGKRRLRAWPDISETTVKTTVEGASVDITDYDISGLATVDYAKLRETGGKEGDGYKMTSRGLHNNDVYDTSVLNLIEKLAPTKAALRPTDFAYCKNLGVYPNNRLMIVRRFAGPSDDNIMVRRKSTEIPSLATVITWVKDDENFVELNFGEEWTEAKASFTGILNSLGEDFGRKAESTGLGDILSKGAGALPLPGFSEIFQRQFLASIGLLEEGSAAGIPAGNPNLIKEAKVRKTVGYDEAGSGLMCKLSFKVSAEYELKFISGIDPTVVWMDLIGTFLRFGTSESSNYGLSKAFAAKIKRWVSNPNHLLREMLSSVKKVISETAAKLKEKITAAWNAATKAAQELPGPEEEGTEEEKPKSERTLAEELANKVKDAANSLVNKLINIGDDILKGTIMKYRTEVLGIVNALTGSPSTPWHITIGNPLRPMFCSGDMYTTDVSIKLGPQLAFNDLPSSITVEFTLQNARNLGMQEIMSKFNSGYLRTVDVQKTFYETDQVISKDKDGNTKIQLLNAIGGLPYESAEKVQQDNKVTTNPPGTDTTTQNKTNTTNTTNSSTNSGGGDQSSNANNTNASSSTKVEGGQQQTTTVTTDPNQPQK